MICGVIDDIWEVHYGSNIQIPVFRCRWVKHPKGVEVDSYELTIVDLNNIGYKDDPWVLASQVAQVIYVADPANKTCCHPWKRRYHRSRWYRRCGRI